MKVEYWRSRWALISFPTLPTHLISGRYCHFTIFYSESFGTPELFMRILYKHRSAFPFRYSVFDKHDQFIGYNILWEIYDMSILNLIFIYVSFYRPLRSCPKKQRDKRNSAYSCVMYWIKWLPKCLYIQYLVTRKWPYLRRNRSVRSCGLVWGNIHWGWALRCQKSHTRSSIFPQYQFCCLLSDTKKMEWLSETVNKP